MFFCHIQYGPIRFLYYHRSQLVHKTLGKASGEWRENIFFFPLRTAFRAFFFHFNEEMFSFYKTTVTAVSTPWMLLCTMVLFLPRGPVAVRQAEKQSFLYQVFQTLQNYRM